MKNILLISILVLSIIPNGVLASYLKSTSGFSGINVFENSSLDNSLSLINTFVNISTGKQLLEDGSYLIRNPFSDQVLESSLQSGYNAEIGDFKENTTQLWEFKHLGDNIYTIKNVDTQRFLEVPEAKCERKANIATWSGANASHQKFKINKVDGNYFLRPSGCLQFAANRNIGVANANVNLKNYEAFDDHQKWNIIGYTIMTASKSVNKNAKNIAIFPNPAKTIVSIAGLEQETTINITDATGKILISSKISPSNSIINVSGLSPGVYFMSSPSGVFKPQQLLKI